MTSVCMLVLTVCRRRGCDKRLRGSEFILVGAKFRVEEASTKIGQREARIFDRVIDGEKGRGGVKEIGEEEEEDAGNKHKIAAIDRSTSIQPSN